MSWRSLISLALLLAAVPAHAQTSVSPANRREAIEHYRAGQELLVAERWDRALAEFDRAVALDPLLTDAHYGRGQAFMALERYASAIQAFRRCIDAAHEIYDLRDRNRMEADNRVNDTLYEMRDTLRRMRSQAGRQLRANQLEQRIQDLEKSRGTLQGPFVAPAGVLLALGSAHFRNGEPDQAEHYWSEAVTVNPDLGEAWNNLAVVYMRTGRKKAAEDAVKNAERTGFHVHPRLKDDIRAMKRQGPGRV